MTMTVLTFTTLNEIDTAYLSTPRQGWKQKFSQEVHNLLFLH